LVNLLEQLGEFQTAMAFFDACVDLPCQQVQARQEAQGAMALVFIVSAVRGVLPLHRRKVRRHFTNSLDSWLLIQGENRHQLAFIRLRLRTGDSHEPSSRLGRDLGFTTSARTVLQRRQGTHFKRPVEDPLDLWAIRMEGFSQGRDTLPCVVGQQDIGPLDPGLTFRPGFRNGFELGFGFCIENQLGPYGCASHETSDDLQISVGQRMDYEMLFWNLSTSS
jgi:hypothetical protein